MRFLKVRKISLFLGPFSVQKAKAVALRISFFPAEATRKRLTLALICTVFLFFLPGCLDLSQLQQLAKTANGAQTSITKIAGDFKESCERQNFYVSLPPGPAPLERPPEPCANADDFETLGNNLVAEQNTLLLYLDTLGSLGNGNATGFAKMVPKLDSSFKTAGLSSSQQEMAKSAGTLANAVTKMVTAAYRDRKVLEILKEADPAVQQLTKALANQVGSLKGTSYVSLLSNEDLLLRSYYDIPLAQDHTSLTSMLVRVQYHDALALLKKRQTSAAAYQKLMLAIGDAHAKLLANAETHGFTKAGVQRLATDLAQPVADMTAAITTLRKDER